jgi:hypothetical protein
VNPTQAPDFAQHVAENEEAGRRATAIMDADPSIPFISAYVMARDLMSADRSLQWLREGKHDWPTAEVFCGSYGRLDLRARAYEEGLITEDEAVADLPSTWSGSDPDDTDPRFLNLWRKAHRLNGGKMLRDKPRSALPRTRPLAIYRGQDEGAAFGISWSLDFTVALKFANGAATRQHNRKGVVYAATVDRTDVLGYMTGRSEAEVIVAPDKVRVPFVMTRL